MGNFLKSVAFPSIIPKAILPISSYHRLTKFFYSLLLQPLNEVDKDPNTAASIFSTAFNNSLPLKEYSLLGTHTCLELFVLLERAGGSLEVFGAAPISFRTLPHSSQAVMPKFVLELTAQLQGISSFATPPEYPWHVTLGCGNCGEKTEKPVVLSSADQVEGIRGASVNMRITCKLCSRVNDVKILEEEKPYTSEQAPEWARFLVVECRGLELVDVAFADDVPLTILGNEGFVFEDAFIEDGEFYGYDEKLSTEASITELRTRVVRG